MKNLTLSFLLLAVIFSASAQDAKNNLTFKAYTRFIASIPGCGNADYYGPVNFQIGGPTVALAWMRGKGNYHQVELSDLTLNKQMESGLRSNSLLAGIRYSYNISLFKTKNGKVQTWIAPGAHVLVNYSSEANPDQSYLIRYTRITSELEVTPVLAWQLNPHFSIEANAPFTIIGITEEITHCTNSSTPATDNWYRQDSPFLGPQYFQGRIGIACNL